MSNVGHDFNCPTNEIKTLLRIRGQSQTSLSKATGISLYVLNKFINHRTYQGKDGDPHHYQVPHIKEAIESYLHVSGDILWTVAGKETLRKIIADETIAIRRFPKAYHKKSPGRSWSFKTLAKNLISLGKHNFFWR